MSNGVLSLPGSNEKVDVVYKAPRMICASEHTIKLYASELIEATAKRSGFCGSLAVFLSVLPMAINEKGFSDFLTIASGTWHGIFVTISVISGALCLGFAFRWFTLRKKTSPDYLIQRLTENEPWQVQTVITAKAGTPAKVVPLTNFK